MGGEHAYIYKCLVKYINITSTDWNTTQLVKEQCISVCVKRYKLQNTAQMKTIKVLNY